MRPLISTCDRTLIMPYCMVLCHIAAYDAPAGRAGRPAVFFLETLEDGDTWNNGSLVLEDGDTWHNGSLVLSIPAAGLVTTPPSRFAPGDGALPAGTSASLTVHPDLFRATRTAPIRNATQLPTTETISSCCTLLDLTAPDFPDLDFLDLPPCLSPFPFPYFLSFPCL